MHPVAKSKWEESPESLAELLSVLILGQKSRGAVGSSPRRKGQELGFSAGVLRKRTRGKKVMLDLILCIGIGPDPMVPNPKISSGHFAELRLNLGPGHVVLAE